jgi:hypothetical protein
MASSRAVSNREARLGLARQGFAERYHRWKFKDSRRETNKDFPFVRRVRNQRIYRFLEMIELMDQQERERLMTALVKRSDRFRLAHTPETITAEDDSLIQRYLEYDHGEIIPGVRARLPIIRDGVSKRMRMEGEPFGRARIDRKALRQAIVEKLRPICGPKLENYGSRASSYFECNLGPWVVRTGFRMPSKFWHFDYYHDLLTPSGLIVGQGISLEHWLGLGGSQTCWKLEDKYQVDDAVDALGDIVAHFLREAAVFLKGFEPPEKL